MTVDIVSLINRLGVNEDEIYLEGLIPYKSRPQYPLGENIGFIHLVKEGLYLNFYAKTHNLIEIEVIIRSDSSRFLNKNKLPFPFEHNITRINVLKILGSPIKTYKPANLFGIEKGYTDVYYLENNNKIAFSINYNRADLVNSVVYFLSEYKKNIF